MYFQPVIHGTIKGEEDRGIQTIISKKIFVNKDQATQYIPYFIEWLEDSNVFFTNYSSIIAELEIHEEKKMPEPTDNNVDELINEQNHLT